MLNPHWRFSTFRPHLAALPRAPLERANLLSPPLHLCSSGPLECFYAPLDWVNRDARVVLLGAAPGWHEMHLAFRAARDALARDPLPAGAPRDRPEMDILRAARLATLPSGPIRQRLCQLLDRAGLPGLCGLRHAEPLFDPLSRLLHWTWVARFPVFVRGKGGRLHDYRGRDPSILRSHLMRAFTTDALAGELAAIPDATVVPIGPAAADALWLLARLGLLDPARLGPQLPDPGPMTRHDVASWRPTPVPLAPTFTATRASAQSG